ncbi:MAG: glycosyltransferase family 39 protein [Planctomycetes bacterium]|nr:glycosyltransferase family 39 protein [Planctomycetota bacterium]
MNRPVDASEGLLGAAAWIPRESTEADSLPHFQGWLWGFLAFGLLARSVRYFLQFPLWEDECFLCVSVFQRGFQELLRPLEYHQVAPGFFLWIEKAATLLFGFNELALRLVPFLCSLAGLFLFYHLVSRLVRGTARLFAVAFFAVSYPGVRYAAEAKQYGTDLFVSLVGVVLFVEWLRRPAARTWRVALLIWCPLAILLSYPALFTVGAIGLLWLVLTIRHRLRGQWPWWVAFHAAAALSVGGVFLLVVRSQIGAELGFMSEYWGDTFPPRDSLFAFVKWMIVTHTGALLAHPAGAENGGSVVTALFVTLGLIAFLRCGKPKTALLFWLPLALHFAAAVLRRYPYGGHVKFSMYVAPMIYVMFGAGIAALLGLDLRKGKTADFLRNVRIVLIVAAILGLATVARDLLHPYKTKSDLRARAFARWFWSSANFADEAVDLKADLGHEFSRGTWHELSWAAMYLVNKYIYDPGAGPAVRETRSGKPKILRCVLYRDPTKDFDQAAFDRWLEQMKARYPYLGCDVYPFVRRGKDEGAVLTVDYAEIYRFKKPME